MHACNVLSSSCCLAPAGKATPSTEQYSPSDGKEQGVPLVAGTNTNYINTGIATQVSTSSPVVLVWLLLNHPLLCMIMCLS